MKLFMEKINMVNDNNLNKIKGIHFNSGKHIEVGIENEHIRFVREIEKDKHRKKIIAPGLIDVQINGYMGIDFNKKALNKVEWEEVIQSMIKSGVTTFFPTIITNSVQKICEIFEENMKILKKANMYDGVVGGFHLEGPYLSPFDGPRGAHEKKFIK